jgi:hypothetical protein
MISKSLTARIQEIKDGTYTEVQWPWTCLTNASKSLLPGTTTLLCGTPGASKSLMVLQCLRHWHDDGVRACVYELEEDKEFHTLRTLAQKADCSGITDIEWIKDNIDEANRIIDENIDFVDEFTQNMWIADNLPTLEGVAKWTYLRAREGYRVICIDPITAVPCLDGKPWVEENIFLQQIKRTAVTYKCSILLVTHPIKLIGNMPDMASLAGSASYSRFAQSIMWLEYHEPQTSFIRTMMGSTDMEHNRTIHVLKARNGRGQGVRLAYKFEPDSLTLTEVGPIVKKE